MTVRWCYWMVFKLSVWWCLNWNKVSLLQEFRKGWRWTKRTRVNPGKAARTTIFSWLNNCTNMAPDRHRIQMELLPRGHPETGVGKRSNSFSFFGWGRYYKIPLLWLLSRILSQGRVTTDKLVIFSKSIKITEESQSTEVLVPARVSIGVTINPTIRRLALSGSKENSSIFLMFFLN